MRTRRGLGKGLGTGYKNLAPMDSHVHSLSAKGVKTYNFKEPKFIETKGNEKITITCAECGTKISNWSNIFEGKKTSYKCPNCGNEGYAYPNRTKLRAKGKKSGGFYAIGDRWIPFPKVKTNDDLKLRVAYYLSEDDDVNKIKGGRLTLSFTPDGRKGMYSYYVDTLMEDYKTWINGTADLCVDGGSGTSITNMREIVDFTIKNRHEIETSLKGFSYDDKPPKILRAKGKK